MNLSDYLRTKTNKSIRQLAEYAGIDRSTLQRQLNKPNTLTMETLRDIARATEINMLDLFMRAGKITHDELDTLQAGGELTGATDEALAAEVLRRMQDDGSEVLDKPAEVTNLSARRRKVTPEDITEEDLRDDLDAAAFTHRDGDLPDYDSY